MFRISISWSPDDNIINALMLRSVINWIFIAISRYMDTSQNYHQNCIWNLHLQKDLKKICWCSISMSFGFTFCNQLYANLIAAAMSWNNFKIELPMNFVFENLHTYYLKGYEWNLLICDMNSFLFYMLYPNLWKPFSLAMS